MEYLHLQQPIGGLWNNVTVIGVPVSLTAIDENGNVINLGTATSNGYSWRLQSSRGLRQPKAHTRSLLRSREMTLTAVQCQTTAVSVGPAPAAYPEPKEPIPPTDNTVTTLRYSRSCHRSYHRRHSSSALNAQKTTINTLQKSPFSFFIVIKQDQNLTSCLNFLEICTVRFDL